MIVENDVLICVEDSDIIDGVLIIDKNIKVIDESACIEMPLLEELIIPSSVEYIKNYAFADCLNLKKIKFSEGLIGIGMCAFSSSKSLQEVKLPDSLRHLESKAFLESGLKKIELPNNMVTIENKTFKNCAILEEVVCPKNLKIIKEYAFFGCRSLKRINLGECLESIEESAFCHCSELKEVIFPKSLLQVDDSSFSECLSLEKVEFNNNLKHIGYSVFKNCESLKDINIPSSLKRISSCAFEGCIRLEEVSIPNGIERINSGAFSHCKNLRKVIMSDSINYVGESAFLGCSNLEEVILSKNLEYIDNSAFKLCRKLTLINLPDSIEEIGCHAFNGCESLESIKLPDSVKKIKTGTFLGCGKLKEINLPKNLEIIDGFAFRLCCALEKIDFPDTLHFIGGSAFEYTALSYVEIPKNIDEISSAAFSNCRNLKKVELHEGITLIMVDAFSKTAIEEIKLPSNLIQLDVGAFSECKNLKSINIPGSVTKIEEAAFFGCVSLESVVLNEGCEVIGKDAFGNCPSLKSLYLPEGLKYIGENAVTDARNLSRVMFPKSLKKVDMGAFSNCGLDQSLIYNNTNFSYINKKRQNITIVNYYTGEKINTYIDNSRQLAGGDALTIYDWNNLEFFDAENKWTTIVVGEYEKIYEEYLSLDDYVKLYEWRKREKFLPHISVVKNMAVRDIDNFYINDNKKRWKQLSNLIKDDTGVDKQGLFKLAYSVGLFSTNGKDSVRAFNFIREKIVETTISGWGMYHVLYGNFETYKNGYDKEFAELFFKYYNDLLQNNVNSAMELEDNAIDYIGAIYNNFDKIKKAYPNKRVNTNTINEMLTINLCLNVVLSMEYENIDLGNEDFAANMGMYGYTQEYFQHAQKLFNQGKLIPKEEIMLHIVDDEKNYKITYELLDKDNPLGVVLGNITNCCQVLDGAASSCVEYGLSQRNSKFMVFRKGNMIIGQSWVWYDENTRRICLDNIEVPKCILTKNINNKIFLKEWNNCLGRMVSNFIEGMNRHGLEVNSITVGAGYNDISKLLDEEYELIVDQPKLTGYVGYSDASNQYVLYEEGNTIHKKL